jgi:hypothetical protein
MEHLSYNAGIKLILEYMQIKDIIYGTIEIKEQISLDLINTEAFKRLKDVTQSGIPDKWNNIPSYSRYEHSLGVSYLLSRFRAHNREQMTGMLHDISHRAFSHLYEWLLDSDQSQHEDLVESDIEKFLGDDEIQRVFKKYKKLPISLKDFEASKKLDQNLPDLCIDRLDYSFREYYFYKGNNSLYEKCFKHLFWDDNRNIFYFDDANIALFYAKSYLELQEKVWDSWLSSYRYEILSRLFKYSMEKGFIKLEDFDGGESKILGEIDSHLDDETVQKYMKLLETQTSDSKTSFGIIRIKKFRYVDPYVQMGEDKFTRCTDIFPDFKRAIVEAKRNNGKGKKI